MRLAQPANRPQSPRPSPLRRTYFYVYFYFLPHCQTPPEPLELAPWQLHRWWVDFSEVHSFACSVAEAVVVAGSCDPHLRVM
jgi:hypothetical protein